MMLATSVLRPGVATGLWLMVMPSVMVGVIGVLGPLRLNRLGFSAAAIGAVFVVAAAVESLSSILAGRWADPPVVWHHFGQA